MSATSTPTWTLGDRIRKAREHSHLKQSELALRLRVARSTIAGWENETHRPSHADLEAVSRACIDTPIEWLETGTVSEPLTDGQQTPWPEQLVLCLTGS